MTGQPTRSFASQDQPMRCSSHLGPLKLVDLDDQHAPPKSGIESLLSGGEQALHVDGDLRGSRDWFDAAYRAAELEGDCAAMAVAALGLGGLWVHEQRGVVAAVLVDVRVRRALAMVDPQSSVGLRLRARLAAEHDYRVGGHAAIVAVADQAGQAGDPIATAEALSLAHHCLMGPGQGPMRHQLAQDLIVQSFRTARRSDRLMGMLWSVVDLYLDGDRHADRRLVELRELLAAKSHLAVDFVVQAIDVMLSIRAGRLDQAEAQAGVCAAAGMAAGDVDATGWYGGQMVAIRWYQGRIAELIPMLEEMVTSPTLSAVDNSYLAALALATATAGDQRRAAAVLARLRGADLARLPRSSSWLVAMGGIVEAAHLLEDTELLSETYDLLAPFAELPMMVSVGIACYGSVQHALGTASLGLGEIDRAVEHLRVAVRENLALGHSPAAMLSRARLVEALTVRAGHGDCAEAERELGIATHDAAGTGVALPTMAGRRPIPGVGAVGTEQLVVLQRRGRLWEVNLGQRSALVDDSLGMTYLATLLGNPEYEIPAIELAAGRGLPKAIRIEGLMNSGQPVLDEQAKRAYRDKLSALQLEIDEHELNNDLERAERVRTEHDWLVTELSAATGLGGRVRNFANSEERARISVGKAIRRAVSRIETVDPVIGQALRATVQTGLRCCYRPC
jgi:hypothetical protein